MKNDNTPKDKKKKERAFTREEWAEKDRIPVQVGSSMRFSIKPKKFYFSF